MSWIIVLATAALVLAACSHRAPLGEGKIPPGSVDRVTAPNVVDADDGDVAPATDDSFADAESTRVRLTADGGEGRTGDAVADAAVDAGSDGVNDQRPDGMVDGPLDVASDACASTVHADQSVNNAFNLGADINEGARFVGQVYRAGLTGQLSAVSISLQERPGAVAARVTIRQAAEGAPTDVVLATAMLATGGVNPGSFVPFNEPVPQIAGEQYAIVVDYPSAPPAGPDQYQAIWTGVASDVYPGGDMVDSRDGTSWNVQAEYDLRFQTFVLACSGADL